MTCFACFTEQQLAWARSHDWYVCEHADGSLIVRDSYEIEGVLFEGPDVKFCDIRALRDWAGY